MHASHLPARRAGKNASLQNNTVSKITGVHGEQYSKGASVMEWRYISLSCTSLTVLLLVKLSAIC